MLRQLCLSGNFVVVAASYLDQPWCVCLLEAEVIIFYLIVYVVCFWRLSVLCGVVGAFLLLAMIWLDLVCGWRVASPCWRSFLVMVQVK